MDVYLIRVTFERYGCTPFEISSNASWLETFTEPSFGDSSSRICPMTCLTRLVEPC